MNDTEMLALEEEKEANLEEVHDISIMKKARCLVGHFSKSNQQFEKLKEQQKTMETYNGNLQWKPTMENRQLVWLLM